MKLFLVLTEAFDIKDPTQVANRIEVYRRISKESNGPGERATAETLLKKLIIAAKAAGTYRDPAAKATYDKPKSSYNPHNSYSKPKEEPKKDSNLEAFKIIFLGHYEDFSNNSNKMWGWGTRDGKIWQFWGRYNGTPQIKMAGTVNDISLESMRKLAKSKEAKGYEKVYLPDHIDWIQKVHNGIRKYDTY